MKPDIPPIAGLPKCWLWGKCKRTRHEKMKKESVEIAGNRLVWRHIQKERDLVQGLSEEDRKMFLGRLIVSKNDTNDTHRVGIGWGLK